MDADLVTFRDHAALLVRIGQGRDRRHVEGRLDVVALEHLQDARHADPVAVLAPGHAADRLAAVAELVGLVIRIEGQREGATRAARP